MPLSQIVSASIEDGAVAPVDLSANAQFYNYKNKIINGSFQVWQRATTYALTSSFAYGSADRWAFAMGATAAGTASQVVSGLTGFQYALKLSRNSGSTSTGFLYADQVVENANTYDLQGQTAVVSFWAKAGTNYSAAGSALGVTVNTGAGSTDSSSLTATFGGWTGNAQPYTGAITISTTWTRYSVTCTLGSTITNIGILFSFLPSGTAGADDAVYITGVQLEKGVTATSFDVRPYGTELLLCQRYFYSNVINAQGGFFGNYYSGNASTAFGIGTYKTSMRATPTIVLYDAGGNVQGACTQANVSDNIPATAGQIGPEGFSTVVRTTGSFNATFGAAVRAGFTASAEL